MGKPITWQNVNGPSLTDAAAPLAAAQRSFDTAFSRVGDELVRRQATQDANYAQGKINNTEAFLAQISQYRTPDELQAAQQSGALGNMLQGFGGQVDQAAVRQAQDLRPGVLQERVQREGAFADNQLARTERPLVDQFNSLVASGDHAGAQTLLNNNNLQNEGPMAQALATALRAKVVAGRQDTQYAQTQALVPLQKQKLEGDIAAQAADTKIRQTTAESLAADRVARQKIADQEAAAKKVEMAIKAREAESLRIVKGTALESGDLRSGSAMGKVQEAMGKLKDVTPQNINEMYAAINDIAPGGMIKVTRGGKTTELPVPVDVVIKALQGAYDSWSPFSDHGDAVRSAIKKAMDAPALQDEIIGVESRRALLDASSKPADAGPAPAVVPGPAPAGELGVLDRFIQQRMNNGSLPASMGGKPLPK